MNTPVPLGYGQPLLFEDDDLAGTPKPEMGNTDPAMPGNSNPEMGKSNPGTSPTVPPGQARSRDGQGLPRAAVGGLPYAFDWSTTRGVTCVRPDGLTIRCDTLTELVRDIPSGSLLVGESTFCSYDVDERQRVIELAEARGVILRTVPARGNTRRRIAAGLPEKSVQSKLIDREDALGIQWVAAHGAHLKKPSALVDDSWAELSQQARSRFVRLRRSGKKEAYAQELAGKLPPYLLQPIERRIALGPTGGYNLVIVAAVGVAAEYTSNRQDFERLVGMYAHGYPSQFRSDLMHWGWNKYPVKRERIKISVYRREIRWLFNQIKEMQ